MEDFGLIFKRINVEDPVPEFDCGDNDLNEFFLRDSREGARELISVTYAIIEKNIGLVGYFCVSNDAIRRQDTSNNKFNKIRSGIPESKRYSSMPAVKIGRLATATKYQSKGIGRKTLDLIKMWFTEGNKTGCRFIIVDAMNSPRTLEFYKKNGFNFLDAHKEEKKNGHTRLMFFDLLTFRP